MSVDLVASDTATHYAAQNDIVPQAFDEYDADHVGAVVPYELVKPVQSLLLTLALIEQTPSSFGADSAKVMEALLPDLKQLRKGCIEIWRDL